LSKKVLPYHDEFISDKVQSNPISELPLLFRNKIAREVRSFYEGRPRLIEEYEFLTDNGTVRDMKNWLSNVGREPLYGRIVELLERGELR